MKSENDSQANGAPAFLGVDHIDLRVPSLSVAREFYDRFMPALGLVARRYAFVDERGEWMYCVHDSEANVIEYYERSGAEAARFVGIIEAPSQPSTQTRIAFRVTAGALESWYRRLRDMGARNVERSSDMTAYPALFFQDPCGTKLELCARRAQGG